MNTPEVFPFKAGEMIPQYSWIQYGFVLVMLFIILFMLTKKSRSLTRMQAHCHVIEKNQLSSKLTLYVVRHQQQRFLLIDNQHALAIHALMPEHTDV